MTVAGPLADLVDQAHRRGRLAAVLGRLLLAEPDGDVAGVVESIPALAPLAGPGLASEFERLLLREVPVYESVFLGDDGARGGERPARLAEVYGRHGFAEAGRWRVAGVDHLGLELRFLAHLCAAEAAAWSDDRPDEAARLIEAERDFLATHLGRWGQVAAEALRDRAGESPFGALAEAVAQLLADEAERLRPDPDHPGSPPVEVQRPPAVVGPARLARWLLAPATCGAWLSADELGAAATSLGIPWRPSDPRSRFRQVVEAAVDGGDLAELLHRIAPAVERWRDRHAALEAAAPGAGRQWRRWRLQAEETLALVERLSGGPAGPGRGRGGPVVVTVGGTGDGHHGTAGADVIARLAGIGARVAVRVELPAPVADLVGGLVGAGADEVLLTGRHLTAVAFAEGGDEGDRQARHLGDADVVVRIVPGPDPVSVEAGGDAGLAERVAEALRPVAAR